MIELMTALLMWIGTPDLPRPDVFFVPRSRITELTGAPPNVAVAAYLCRVRAMFLANDSDLVSVRGRSAVLHELVHHRQCLEGRWVDGVRSVWLECEAYRVQNDYLRQYGRALDPRLIKILRKGCGKRLGWGSDQSIPPPPEGFVLDQPRPPAAIPPPPEGYFVDPQDPYRAIPIPPPPEGYVLDAPATAGKGGAP